MGGSVVGRQGSPGQQLNERVWDRLRRVAKPDSRLHFDFARMHPDFEGADQAAARVMEACAVPPRIAFVVPDGALAAPRERLLRSGCRLVVSTFRMLRGFRLLDPAHLAATDLAFAATLDGLERFGTPLSVAALAELGRMDLVLTGAAAVAENGVRFGRGYHYFDLEWGLLSTVGVVAEGTLLGAVVHDVQVTSDRLDPLSREAVPDFIATPTRLIRVRQRPNRPKEIDWTAIDPDDLEAMPPMVELHRAQGLRR